MSAPELKPCPFCGGVPYLANKEMPGGAFVVCTDCRAATDDGCIDTAIERWNTRADLAPAAPKVKALVWHDNPDIGEGGFIAKGVFGCAYHAMEDGWSYYRQGLWADTKSLEAAKAAAQADYEARILAALEGGDG